jgi:hypothetical protein
VRPSAKRRKGDEDESLESGEQVAKGSVKPLHAAEDQIPEDDSSSGQSEAGNGTGRKLRVEMHSRFVARAKKNPRGGGTTSPRQRAKKKKALSLIEGSTE